MYNLNQFVMIKKHLLGGALLVAVLVLLSGCKEIMSNLSNPVSAYLQLKQASVKIYRGQSFKMSDYYSTISDAKPIFTSADESIATVDENGVVTGANRGTTKITIEVPANEYYNGATIELEVEVDALLVLPKDAKELALNEEYNLGVTSVSKGKITYKSSNTDVATVDADGNVTAKGYGDATITVSIAATPEYDRTESVDFAAKVCVLNEAELNAIINTAAAGDGKVKVMLKDGFELENDLNLEGKKIELDLMNSILTFKGNHSIIISDNFTLKNAKIDASNSNAQIVKMTTNADVLANVKKNQAVYTNAAKTDYYYLESIDIENVWVKELKSDFITASNAKWGIDNLIIKNSIVQANYTGSGSSFLYFGGGSIHNMDVENNLLYNIDNKGTQRFISHGNSSDGVKVWGTTAKGGDGTPATAGSRMLWKFNNNVTIKVGYNKYGNNVPNSNNNMFMEGNNNIFYDAYKVYEFFRVGQAANKTTVGNIIWNPNLTEVHTNDAGPNCRKDKDGNPLSVIEDPGITVPTEPLDLEKGVKIK